MLGGIGVPMAVGGEPEGGGAGLVDEDTGESDEPVAVGASGSDWAVEADDAGPAAQVVCEHGAGEPGTVGGRRGSVRARRL